MLQYSESLVYEKFPPCFNKLRQREFELIKQNIIEVKYKKGETIYKQGVFISRIIYLVKGLVKVYLKGVNNKNLIFKIIKPYDFIGLSSLYGEKYYHYSVTTLINTTICLIKKDVISKLIYNNNDFALEIIKWYCMNDSLIFSKLTNISYKSTYARIADSLLYLNKVFDNKNIIPLAKRKDIAELSGISVESAVRSLTKFKNEGIINTYGKNIEIVNEKLLEEISIKGY